MLKECLSDLRGEPTSLQTLGFSGTLANCTTLRHRLPTVWAVPVVYSSPPCGCLQQQWHCRAGTDWVGPLGQHDTWGERFHPSHRATHLRDLPTKRFFLTLIKNPSPVVLAIMHKWMEKPSTVFFQLSVISWKSFNPNPVLIFLRQTNAD